MRVDAREWRRRWFWFLAALLIPVHSAWAGPVRITMKDRAFSPETVQIYVGDTVEWVNDDQTVHLVISGRELQDKNLGKPLDSGTLMPGQAYTYTFKEPGTYPYLCVIHWMQDSSTAGLLLRPMKGEVIVEP